MEISKTEAAPIPRDMVQYMGEVPPWERKPIIIIILIIMAMAQIINSTIHIHILTFPGMEVIIVPNMHMAHIVKPVITVIIILVLKTITANITIIKTIIQQVMAINIPQSIITNSLQQSHTRTQEVNMRDIPYIIIKVAVNTE